MERRFQVAGKASTLAKRNRAHHSKSKGGCLNCKNVHVRCDEARPFCGRCVKKSLPCQYRPQIRNALSILLSPQEARSLNYYRQYTSHNLAGHFDQDFWNTIALKLSYSNDTLQHFLIALGSLDEAYSLRSSFGAHDHASSLYAFSLQQYNTGISSIATDKHAQSLPAIVLSACLASILYELWLGSHDVATTHAQAAIRIQGQVLNYQSAQVGGEQLTILHRYLKQIITRTSYHLSATSTLVELPEDGTQCTKTPSTLASDFENLSHELSEQASLAVSELQGSALRVRLQQLLNTLDAWYLKVEPLPDQSDFDKAQERRLLGIRYHAHRIAIGTAPYNDEAAYDDYDDDFRSINGICELFLRASAGSSHSRVVRSHDTTSSMALFLVSCYCRDPQIRRQSVRLLYRYPRLEGIFLTYMTGYWAELVMMLEEDTSAKVRVSRDVPIEKRVRIMDGFYYPGCLAEGANDKSSLTNPPTLSLSLRRKTDSKHYDASTIRTPFTRYHIANGFGDKSSAWWPSGPLHDKSIMRQELSDEQRCKEGPFLGRVPFQIMIAHDVKNWCSLSPCRLVME